jgi:hypothetical protein
MWEEPEWTEISRLKRGKEEQVRETKTVSKRLAVRMEAGTVKRMLRVLRGGRRRNE